MIGEHLSVRALKAMQGVEVPIFSFFLKGGDLLKVAEISRIYREGSGELRSIRTVSLVRSSSRSLIA